MAESGSSDGQTLTAENVASSSTVVNGASDGTATARRELHGTPGTLTFARGAPLTQAFPGADLGNLLNEDDHGVAERSGA